MTDRAISSFLQALRNSQPRTEVAVAEQIISWSIESGLDAEYGPGKRELKFRSPDSGRRLVFSLFAKGDLTVQLRWLLHTAPFSDASDGDELKARLQRAVSGWDRPPSAGGFPNLPLARLHEAGRLEAVLGELAWIVDRVSRGQNLPIGARSTTAGPADRAVGRSPIRAKPPLSSPYVDPPLPRYSSPPQILVDVDQHERKSQEHWQLQKLLADFLRSDPGVELLRPDPEVDPLFDVAWRAGTRTFIAEVKSLPAETERQQMRLGLGQILQYQQRYLDEHDLECKTVLFVAREPDSPTWERLCRRVGVLLCWPDNMQQLRSAAD